MATRNLLRYHSEQCRSGSASENYIYMYLPSERLDQVKYVPRILPDVLGTERCPAKHQDSRRLDQALNCKAIQQPG
jgi:hypothetical protein